MGCLPGSSPRPRHPLARRCAFTLIELLVVVAVIGILTALVFGISGKIMDQTKWMKGASNLRQIWTATTAFAAEHQGRLPCSSAGTVGPKAIAGTPLAGDLGMIGIALGPYLGDPSSPVWLPPDTKLLAYVATPGSPGFGRCWKKIAINAGAGLETDPDGQRYSAFFPSPNHSTSTAANAYGSYRYSLPLAAIHQPSKNVVIGSGDYPNASGKMITPVPLWLWTDGHVSKSR